ncbi:MAG: hypothetical protein AB1898_08835 [Acidobacteriota bacterium]
MMSGTSRIEAIISKIEEMGMEIWQDDRTKTLLVAAGPSILRAALS